MTAPVMWKIGATHSTRSAGVSSIQRAVPRPAARMLPCVFIAPFGGPVVPLV